MREQASDGLGERGRDGGGGGRGGAPRTLFELIGEDGFALMASRFYARVAGDDILGPMYRAAMVEHGEVDLGPAEVRLRDFLVQRFGGPTRYSEARGHPRLRMRHMPFSIGVAERNRWVELMRASMDEALDVVFRVRGDVDPMREVAGDMLGKFFADTATFMMNRDE